MEFSQCNLVGQYVRNNHSREIVKITKVGTDKYGVYEIELHGYWYPTMKYVNIEDFFSEWKICNEIKIAVQDSILRQVVFDALKYSSFYTAFSECGDYMDNQAIHAKFQSILEDIASGIKERDLHI